MSDTFAHTPLVKHLEVETHCNRQHKVLGPLSTSQMAGLKCLSSDRTEMNHKDLSFKSKAS